MTAGKSRFGQVMQKKSPVLQDIVEMSNEAANKPEDTNNNNVVTADPKDANEQKSEGTEEGATEKRDNNEPKITDKPVSMVSGYSDQAFMDLLIKKIQDSSDPRLSRRHPKYKGPRLKRSYILEQNVGEWLLNVNENTHIPMTSIVNDAVKEYLKTKYPNLKPNPQT